MHDAILSANYPVRGGAQGVRIFGSTPDKKKGGALPHRPEVLEGKLDNARKAN
jgi:hypothetical protein